MTEEELTAIEARATAATREPWIVGDMYVPSACLSAVSVYGMGMEVAECQMDADGAFIAAARVDVPALVAEVRRLRAEVGKVSVAEKLVVSRAVEFVDAVALYNDPGVLLDAHLELRVAVANLLAVEAAS